MPPQEAADPAVLALSNRRLARRMTVLGSLLILAGFAALPIDLPTALWFMHNRFPAELHKIICLAEVVAHGLGVTAVLLLVWAIDPDRRRRLARVATMSLGAGMIANGLKLLLARRRPFHFDYQGGPLETFGDWLPWGAGGSGYQSFLSSHGAVATGLALGLAWLYPRGRWVFVAYCALGMMQRLVSDAHYVSDVLWGGGFGLIWGAICLSPKLAGRWFDKLETTTAGAPPSHRAIRPENERKADSAAA